MAGYSHTPLLRKLGLKAGAKAAFLGAPEGYRELLGELPEGARVLSRAGKDMDFVHLFVRRQADLARRLPGLVARLAPAGMLWISWPKKTSELESDVDREVVRELGLGAGLVDVKVCAIDQDWSALKFVFRLADR